MNEMTHRRHRKLKDVDMLVLPETTPHQPQHGDQFASQDSVVPIDMVCNRAFRGRQCLGEIARDSGCSPLGLIARLWVVDLNPAEPFV